MEFGLLILLNFKWRIKFFINIFIFKLIENLLLICYKMVDYIDLCLGLNREEGKLIWCFGI